MTADTLLRRSGTLGPYLRRYAHPAQLGIKINLYRGAEVDGLSAAIEVPDLDDSPIECVMVGDSYFMTHLGRASTVLDDPVEREWALSTMVDLVVEVRRALDARFTRDRRPFLLADLPDGSFDDERSALLASDRFMARGADAVKVEVAGWETLRSVEAVAERGIPVLAHLGYTPQRGRLTRYGDSYDEALGIFEMARRARDAGACGLVLEMVSEQVNEALSRPHRDGLPTYSVFSGRARWGGQSLNIWDAVVKPAKPRRYFPPTAVIEAAEVGDKYDPELIADRMRELLRLTLAGWFPTSPPAALKPGELADVDPWESA